MAEPITVPDLDDTKEQEKLRRESSEQSESNEAQRKFELIEERLKAVEGSDVRRVWFSGRKNDELGP